jgi:hypothetical protein
MLSNAIDFRSRRKQRPKSADFEIVDEVDGERVRERREKHLLEPPRSASVTDLLESVTISKKERILEGRNSAPDIIPNIKQLEIKDRFGRHRPRGTTSSVTKQKLSTRFQPQRKPAHRVSHSNSVKRAKTFNHGGPVTLISAASSQKPPTPQPKGYTTLPKQSSNRSLVSSTSSNEGSQGSADSGQGTQSSSTDTSSTGSRKSSNSSYTSTNSSPANLDDAAINISQSALDEIAAFEKFIVKYFDATDNNNTVTVKKPEIVKSPHHKKVSSSTALAEILELSI